MRVSLHRHRLVAALEQMTHPTMAPIEPLRIHPVQLPHPPRQRRLQCHHEKMEVIPHQAVGQHAPAVSLGHLGEDLEEPLPIPIIPDTPAPARSHAQRHGRHRQHARSAEDEPRWNQRIASTGNSTQCGKIVTKRAQAHRGDRRWNEEDLTPLSHAARRGARRLPRTRRGVPAGSRLTGRPTVGPLSTITSAGCAPSGVTTRPLGTLVRARVGATGCRAGRRRRERAAQRS